MIKKKMLIGCLLLVGFIHAGEQKVSHPFICGDIHGQQVMKVDAAGKAVWSFPAKMVHDVWGLSNGNILFAGPAAGVQEVSAEKKVVWQYKAGKGLKVYGCQPLPNGDVMVVIYGKTPKIIEVGRDGKIHKEVPIKAKGDIRLARKSNSGIYLLAARKERAIHQLDSQGNITRRIPVPGNPYLAVELQNGNILIACGDGHTIIEVDRDDKIVWQIKENELPGNPLRFIAGFQRLPNGNTVVCNWGGHGHIGEQPHIFEVTRKKQIVWQIFDNEQFKTLVHVQLLDVSGDAEKGELIR